MDSEKTSTYSVYCDESCHLEHDRHRVMVLGAIWLPTESNRDIARSIRDVKARHGLSDQFEVKWTKVSPAGLEFYVDLLDYFFDEPDLRFRAVVAEKAGLRHADYRQTHDDWYFKMYFILLKTILSQGSGFRIYLDVKDTRSAPKVRKLWDVLCNNARDFSRSVITNVQTVRSSEVQALQLSDLLTGAVSYANRELSSSSAKARLVQLLKQRSKHPLVSSTPYAEQKLNLLVWTPQLENESSDSDLAS